MSAARYVPERGDLLWLTFDPQVGHERPGRTFAASGTIVFSNEAP